MYLSPSPVKVAWEPVRPPPEAPVEAKTVEDLPTRAKSLANQRRRSKQRRNSILKSSLCAMVVLAAGATAFAPLLVAPDKDRIAAVLDAEIFDGVPTVKTDIGTAMSLDRASFTSQPAPTLTAPQSSTSKDTTAGHPVNQKRITSPFGLRTNPLTGESGQLHLGQDYGVQCGTPVYASGAGAVTRSEWALWSGKRIDIDHGNGLKTGYSHNSKLVVQRGQSVSKGQLIAYSGTTGNSTGCHVHFETVQGDNFVDPVSVVGQVSGQKLSSTPHATEPGYSTKWGISWTQQR